MAQQAVAREATVAATVAVASAVDRPVAGGWVGAVVQKATQAAPVVLMVANQAVREGARRGPMHFVTTPCLAGRPSAALDPESRHIVPTR